ncbi:jg26491 [Pararge aegeria aegeria]|uniref:Jg26491 protein n=1 Tax=Pararge aegeria aegeria TaxID=348720 RepID=A0A8S4RY79_9NEOP|nr:jg26491 [Pararge aegeria aegeria]
MREIAQGTMKFNLFWSCDAFKQLAADYTVLRSQRHDNSYSSCIMGSPDTHDGGRQVRARHAQRRSWEGKTSDTLY